MLSSHSALLLMVTLIALVVEPCTSASPFHSLGRRSATRQFAHKQLAVKSGVDLSSFLYWAVAAAPDYLWVGSFYQRNASSLVYSAMLQQVDRATLIPTANLTLPDYTFFDHIMTSADGSLVYVNV